MRGDASGDGRIDIVDALFIAQFTAGLRHSLGVAAQTPVLDPHQPVIGTDSLTVTGRAQADSTIEVSGPNGMLEVPVTVAGTFAADVPLAPQGINRVSQIFFASVPQCGSRSAPVAITVTNDSQAPTVFIDSPASGAQITTASVAVAGRIGDTLSGFMGLTVTVNGVAAIVDSGIGSNGTFLALDVPLALGAATEIVATAIDALGNAATDTVTVSRAEVTPDASLIEIVSGNDQSAPVGAQLAQPIVARIRTGGGTPVANVPVRFTVQRSDGRVSSDATAEGALTIDLETDADGLARAFWRLGSDSGCGNNRVEATSPDALGAASFVASGQPGPPVQINIASGNNQRGESGARLSLPLKVWVHDGRNQVANVPVTFTVAEGGGQVNGASTIVRDADATGHAEVSFTVGPGGGANVVEAAFPGNPGLPAVFIATGISRDAAKPTTFSGLVLDNTNQPIQGAEVTLVAGAARLFSSAPNSFDTTSDLDGVFRFENIDFSGPASLFVDGLMAFHVGGAGGTDVPRGSFPSLHFETVLVANAENSLPMPVLLLLRYSPKR